ncbi:LysR family transcriptional regulator [Streptomyces sp. LP11]|uniref:LysR family transcriptional regulator n=1 Tax=Streptomyces pyxinicus TaxID=2970331 RepID=A0ABT2B721_9ACTN|nr:LysR family transcriptional regulator [Streptomyces sp. LP11]MCS0603738.1 LysR family transcriptional regulator [Streptomyces sp. LP11]
MTSAVRPPAEPPTPGSLDLNLLVALDALLEEESVTGAAERLRLSAPAVSRTLGRIRAVLGDPVLVRAGRGLVPTPYALELRPRVRALVEQAQAVLAPQPAADPARLTRRFTLQANEMVLTAFAARLIGAVSRQAPGVVLRFLPETSEETPALRDGRLDLEIGVITRPEPEILVEHLGGTRFLGVVRPGHPLLDAVRKGKRAAARAFAAADHIGVSRRGRVHGPVDESLAELGLRRRVVATLPGYTAALFLCRETDLVCLTPVGVAEHYPAALGLRTFEVPVPLPPVEVAMAWHPRDDADPGHQWLRDRVREVWRSAPQPAGQP